MAYVDLPLDALRAHRTGVVSPPDLRGFWADALSVARTAATSPAVCDEIVQPLRTIRTWDVRFPGHGGEPIAAWLHRPATAADDDALPCVVVYAGYNGGRGLAHESTTWASAGYAMLVMDTRGQGSGWAVGVTPDPVGSGPSHPGFLTRGLTAPAAYYYCRLITDAVRADDAARSLPGVDADRIAVAGGSQGGGLAIAATALADQVSAALVDVPFLCEIERGAWITDSDPYAEVRRYLAARRDAVEQASRTLAYVDGSVLGSLADAPALFSVALMDDVCPPSTVYAAYNAWAGTKEIVEYPYNAHEGGGAHHVARQLAWLGDRWGTTRS